jgi:hypothetical protein
MTFPRISSLRRAIVSAAIVVLLGTSAPPIGAGPNSSAKILIHLARVDKVQPCSYLPLRPPCDGIVTTDQWPGNLSAFYHCPLLVTDGNAATGLAGLSCGIDYPQADLFIGFASCAEGYVSFAGPNGAWPSDGSGVTLDWDPASTGCQQYEPGGPGTGVVAIAGSFYIASYLEDASPSVVVAVTPHPQSGLATVQSCAGDVDVVETTGSPNSPYRLGRVGISADGTTAGYNPCGQAVAVASSSWGAIKMLTR